MSFMPYVSPDQMMKDRSEYAHKGIARGRSVIGMEYADGLLFVAENPSSTLHKISEIYDRIAFAGVGKYSEFEDLRIAGIRHADLRGYSYGREDVKARDLANAYSQSLSTIFTQQMKPYEVEILVGEVDGDVSGTTLYHVLFDGSVTDEHGFIAIGGHAEDLTEAMKQQIPRGLGPRDGGQDGDLGARRARSATDRGERRRGGGLGSHPGASPEVPPPRRPRGQSDPVEPGSLGFEALRGGVTARGLACSCPVVLAGVALRADQDTSRALTTPRHRLVEGSRVRRLFERDRGDEVRHGIPVPEVGGILPAIVVPREEDRAGPRIARDARGTRCPR